MVIMKGNFPMIAWHSDLYKGADSILIIYAIPHVMVALVAMVHIGLFVRWIIKDKKLPN